MSKEFKKEINMENKEEMETFLRDHFRYYIANNWNRLSSYANNMKIYNFGLSSEIENKLYDMLETDEFNDRLSNLIWDFALNNDYKWQSGWNGRSGGYLVLYAGGRKELDYKSRCTNCGQLNYGSVAETGNRKCGHCGGETQVDLTSPIYHPYLSWGSIDQDADFEDWDMDELKERVQLVTDFDQLCDDIVAEAVYLAENYDLSDETYYVPHTRKVLTERPA